MKTVSPVSKTTTRTLRISTLTLLLLLSACATRTQTRVTSAATTPLSDLNLMRDEIPEVLQNALKQPYLAPSEATCSPVVTEVHQLDAVLGADALLFDLHDADKFHYSDAVANEAMRLRPVAPPRHARTRLRPRPTREFRTGGGRPSRARRAWPMECASLVWSRTKPPRRLIRRL